MGAKVSKPLRDSARNVLARRQIPSPNDAPVIKPPEITPTATTTVTNDIPSSSSFTTQAVPSVQHVVNSTYNSSNNSNNVDTNSNTNANNSHDTSTESAPTPPPAQSSASVFANNIANSAPLPPDLLAAISKWQVRKKVGSALPNTSSGNNSSENSNKDLIDQNSSNGIQVVRFQSTASIRQKKDLEMSRREEQGLPLIGRLTEMQLHEFYKVVRDHPQITAVEIAQEFQLTENIAQLLLDVARLPVIVKAEDDSESVAI